MIKRDCPEHVPEFEIALHCGVRLGEQHKLSWHDVGPGARISLRQTKNGSTRAGSCLYRRARQAVEEPEALVGQGTRGTRNRGLPLARSRHTFASRFVTAGVDLRTVAQLLCQRTLQMVMRYAHLSQSY